MRPNFAVKLKRHDKASGSGRRSRRFSV